MQAFRADTTIDERGALHVLNLPFRPGTLVEVIVLEQGRMETANLRSPRLADPKDAVHFRMEVADLAEGSEDDEL